MKSAKNRGNPASDGSAAGASAGFALALTVALLAFAALLLIAMAVLARMETNITGSTQKQSVARQNALVALDIAVGQLQKMAGPDQRVTAAADALASGNPHYTGVWRTDTDGVAPLTWLVSGNERLDPLAVTPTEAGADTVELVGQQTSDRAEDVVVPLQSVTSTGFPGQDSVVTIGHYAWWVGDQGVKAPVAGPCSVEEPDYPPYDSDEQRNRLRQQIGFGPGAADFEPADGVNVPLIRNLIAFDQLAYLRKGDGSLVGHDVLRRNFHAWSPDNLSVLANTKEGGLRRDLSARPDLLGPAFTAWADYATGLEDPRAPATPAPAPAYSGDPLRRRQRMLPGTNSGNISHGVWPVISYFLLSFNVRTQGGSSAVKPIETRARWMLTLWNPYTSALVPEDLRVEVTGLPSSVQLVDETLGTSPAIISLPAVYGSPLRIHLPWDHASAPDPDRQSWLPGRVYTWTSLEDLSGTAPPAGYATKFYSRNLSADGGQGVHHGTNAGALDGDDVCHLAVAARHTLQVRLSVARPGGDVLLATFTSPEYRGFTTTPRKLSSGTYQFSYLFRLGESLDTPVAPETWLTTPGSDLRDRELGPGAFVAGANGPRPELYENYATISAPDRLFDRAVNARSYNEDVPLFELPRAPVLSLGLLQHLALAGTRPFAIGNPWGAAVQVSGIPANALFDQFHFSGLGRGVVLPSGKSLPNPALRLLRRRSDGTLPGPAELAVQAATGFPAAYLLQGGTFNLNSTNPQAWLAVLRSQRQPLPRSFGFLDTAGSSGTAGDTAVRTLNATGALFFRFPQSAQETWKADDPAAGSTYAASTAVRPAAPNNASTANTHLFRRGLRQLSAAEAAMLADTIAALTTARLSHAGPWRSLEEFLNPSGLFPDVHGRQLSLLEKAIADAGLNAGIAEFSSQWLTQGDMMTALAPSLLPRSDTFIVRAYGDAFNPVTKVVEGRAWAEALVQRTPDYCDPGDPAETPASGLNPLNARLGRRFKIVSFRWLTGSDI